MSTDNSADILLASRSPRRRELLEQIGIRYRLISVDVDETPGHGELPEQYVQRLALEKARAGHEQFVSSELPVLGADTAVVLDQDILGKPVDREQAAEMLRQLSGREHRVMTAVAVVGNQAAEVSLSVSTVRFAQLTEGQIQTYLRTGEADDKAGAYAIQGRAAVFVKHLAGSYSGIVGLPLFETAQLLVNQGIKAGSLYE